MSVQTTEKVNDSIPGIFGSNFTPSKIPLTWAQEIKRTAQLGTVFFAACLGVNHLRNEGLLNDIVLAPIVEDILFGLFFTKILDVSLNVFQGRPKTENQEKTRATVRAVTISAFFALTHGDGLLGSLVHFWFLGRALGYLREETGGFAIPIALHMVHNGLYAVKERLKPGSYSSLVPFAIIATIHIVTLKVLGKNINPWNSMFPQKKPVLTKPNSPQ